MHANRAKKCGPQEKGIRTSLVRLEKPLQKSWAGYISTMTQSFKRISKYNTSSFYSLSNISK